MSTTQTTEKAEAHTAEVRAQHTPGPWHAVYSNLRHSHEILKDYGDRAYELAFTAANQDPVEDKANARLIAAAPELLEACKIMVEAFNGCTCTDEHKSEGVPCPWCMGADAIAKAEKGAL